MIALEAHTVHGIVVAVAAHQQQLSGRKCMPEAHIIDCTRGNDFRVINQLAHFPELVCSFANDSPAAGVTCLSLLETYLSVHIRKSRGIRL
jgi:hypothetical protein